MNGKTRLSGFSMIEVLIAVLILAVGLLGVAALQLSSLSAGQEGHFRAQATAIAEDFASRVRANRDIARMPTPPWGAPAWSPPAPGVPNPIGAIQTYLATYYIATPHVCNAAPTICRTDNGVNPGVCAIADQVAFDIYESCQQALTLLPNGQLWSKVLGSRLTVAVSWAAAEGREDTEEEIVVNPLCRTEFNALADTDDCVLIEVVP